MRYDLVTRSSLKEARMCNDCLWVVVSVNSYSFRSGGSSHVSVPRMYTAQEDDLFTFECICQVGGH